MKHLNEVAREPLLGRYEPGEKETYILPNCLRKMLIDNGFFLRKEHPWFQGPWICRKQTGKPASWKEQRKGDHR